MLGFVDAAVQHPSSELISVADPITVAHPSSNALGPGSGQLPNKTMQHSEPASEAFALFALLKYEN